jgi:hypothetical protein
MVAARSIAIELVFLSRGQTDVRASFDLSVSGKANLVPAPGTNYKSGGTLPGFEAAITVGSAGAVVLPVGGFLTFFGKSGAAHSAFIPSVSDFHDDFHEKGLSLLGMKAPAIAPSIVKITTAPATLGSLKSTR